MEAKFRALEGSNVDQDLAAMKAALGSGKTAGQVRRTGGAGERSGAACAAPGGAAPAPAPRVASCARRPGVSPVQLPPGRPIREAIDYDLQDLKKKMGN